VGVERSGENLRTSDIPSTASDGNTGFPRFPQPGEPLESHVIIGESRLFNISSHSTTTKFLI